jgi:hypothetical protein
VPVAALISISGDCTGVPDGFPALQLLFGQTLLERQVRQLARAGVGHIVLYAPTLPATLIRVVDKLAKLPISVDLTRTARDAADRIHPEERLIVVDGGLMLPDSAVVALASGGTNMILTVPDTADPEKFERVDARDRWAGAMAFDGSVLRQTAGILGEWDLAPTLLRIVLQKGADRITLSGIGPDIGLARPLGAAEITKASGAHWGLSTVPSGLFERWIAYPVAARIGVALAQSLISHSILKIVSIILYILSFMISMWSSGAIGFAVFSLASIVLSTTRLVRASVLDVEGAIERLFTWRGALLGAIVIVTVARLPVGLGDNTPTVFAVWFVLQWALLDQLRSRSDATPSWQIDSGAIAVILAIASALYVLQFGIALALVALIAEHFWRQRRLVRP